MSNKAPEYFTVDLQHPEASEYIGTFTVELYPGEKPDKPDEYAIRLAPPVAEEHQTDKGTPRETSRRETPSDQQNADLVVRMISMKAWDEILHIVSIEGPKASVNTIKRAIESLPFLKEDTQPL